ncbi:MFS transporter [Bacillus subtilis]|nr:MFS transporter [Bacillus subtilis]
MKQIFTINMLFSFLFGALTAILPLSILMTGAASGMSGNVIGIFMIALFVTRIILMFLNPSKKILLLGCLLFLIGILLWLFFYHVLFVYFLVGIILGISVGVIPPLLIVFALGLKKEEAGKSLSWINISQAAGSAFAPLLAEVVFKQFSLVLLLQIFLIMSLTILLISFFIQPPVSNTMGISNKSDVKFLLKDRGFWKYCFFYLLGSLSYGCAIAYGPILLSGEGGSSIGLFYFLFWLFFVISQFLIRKIPQHIHSEPINLLICFILMFFGSAGLWFANIQILFVLCSSSLGFSFGFITIFLQKTIAKSIADHLQTSAFSLFSLMSYLAVGLSGFIFAPIVNYSIKLPFLISPVFSLIFAAILIFFSWPLKKALNEKSM